MYLINNAVLALVVASFGTTVAMTLMRSSASLASAGDVGNSNFFNKRKEGSFGVVSEEHARMAVRGILKYNIKL